MLSKLNEIDSFEEFCVMAREAGMPCEPEDYEEFKFNKERMLEMNTRLLRKLLSWWDYSRSLKQMDDEPPKDLNGR